MGVPGGDARRRDHRRPPVAVSRTSALSGPARWPPLTSTACGPSAQQRARPRASIAARSAAAGSSSRRAASGRFGVTTMAQRQQRVADGRDRSSRKQRVAARRHHDRVEHEAYRLVASRPSATAAMRSGAREHADLHRVDRESSKTASICGSDEGGGTSVDRGDAEGVLRGERGDHRAP